MGKRTKKIDLDLFGKTLACATSRHELEGHARRGSCRGHGICHVDRGGGSCIVERKRWLNGVDSKNTCPTLTG